MENQLYVERLYPAIGMYLAYSLSFPLVLLAAAPFGWSLAITLAIVATAALAIIATLSSPLLVVDEQRLMSGRLSLPLSALGVVQIIPAEDRQSELGPRLNAKAQLRIRGDIKTLVKLEIADPADPTPYVLISSRRPEELVGALRANRTKLGL